MAGAGKLPFGVIMGTLFILHFATVSSGGLNEYSIECEETNATLLSTCEAKLTKKEALVARTEVELTQTRNQLAESRTELARKEPKLAENLAELAQKES